MRDGEFAEVVIAHLLVRTHCVPTQHRSWRQLAEKPIPAPEIRAELRQRELGVREARGDGFIRHRDADKAQLRERATQHQRGFAREPSVSAVVQAVDIPQQADGGIDVEQAGAGHDNSAFNRAISAAETFRTG